MGKQICLDSATAVFEFDAHETADWNAVKLLLNVDLKDLDIKRHVLPLLSYQCIAHHASSQFELVSAPDSIETEAHNELAQMGFFLKGVPLPSTGLSYRYRCYITMDEAVRRVTELAEGVQYLAKLHLLACGDNRHPDMISDVTQDCSHFRFNLELPPIIVNDISSRKLPTDVEFDIEAICQTEDDGWSTVPVSISSFSMRQNSSLIQNDKADSLGTPTSLKSAIAALLLQSLINYQSSMLYEFDHVNSTLKRNEDSDVIAAFADAVIEGKVKACPHCGRPLLMLRQSSRPFCKSSHQTRYSEDAKRAFEERIRELGESEHSAVVDEVSKRFPHIKRATIENWR